MSRPPVQKGAAATGIRPLAPRLLDFHLTGGEASDSTRFETSLDIGPDIRPRIAMTDKGYDSQANRDAARARGITPVIPRRENSKQRGRFFPKRLYKLRARIEQTIGKLKRFKRVAMRREKTDASYSAIVSFACGLLLVKSVHTAEFRPTPRQIKEALRRRDDGEPMRDIARSYNVSHGTISRLEGL